MIYHDRELAFTLAEVLITLGVIGIVAAMTLPTLISNHKNKVTISKLKKVYAEIQQTILQAENESYFFRDINDAESNHTFVEKNIFPKYSGAQYFYSDNAYYNKSMCGNKIQPYHWRNSNNQGVTSGALPSWPSPSVLNASGACIVYWYESNLNLITVDLDGYKKGKNSLGSDVFMFQIDKNKNRLVPYGFDKTESQILTDCPDKKHISLSPGGSFCVARIMNDGWEIKYD